MIAWNQCTYIHRQLGMDWINSRNNSEVLYGSVQKRTLHPCTVFYIFNILAHIKVTFFQEHWAKTKSGDLMEKSLCKYGRQYNRDNYLFAICVTSCCFSVGKERSISLHGEGLIAGCFSWFPTARSNLTS